MRVCGPPSRSVTGSTRSSDLTDADGMRLGELEGIVGDEDGYSAESDAAILLSGLDIPDELHERPMAELQGGQKVRVLLAQALFGQTAGAAARRADQPPRPRLDPLAEATSSSATTARSSSSRTTGTSSTPCARTSADIDYETIITYTGGYDDMVVAKTQIRSQDRGRQRAAREEDRAAERLHRALLGRHAFEPGDVAQEGSRAAADQRPRALQHPAPLHQVRHRAAVGQGRARVQGRAQGYERPRGHSRLLRRRQSR
jgi:ATPase subunit of ABC transporter with duplicated ATPase domains